MQIFVRLISLVFTFKMCAILFLNYQLDIYKKNNEASVFIYIENPTNSP